MVKDEDFNDFLLLTTYTSVPPGDGPDDLVRNLLLGTHLPNSVR